MRPLQLTAKEFELLAYLARHAGKVCTHHMILKDVWGPGYGAESNYVRVYTHRLRKKMGDEEGRLLQDRPRRRLPAGRRRSFRRGERVERVAHQEHAALERRRALGDDTRSGSHPGHARHGPWKRRTNAPVPSTRTASVRTQGRSKETTDSISPATRDRCRGTNAAMAVVAHLTS